MGRAYRGMGQLFWTGWLMFAVWAHGAGAATELTLRDADTHQQEVSVSPGDVLKLELVADVGSIEINGISALILYDAQYLRVRDAEPGQPGIQPCRPGNFLQGIVLQNALDVSDPTQPRILYSLGSLSDKASGTGVVVTLEFEVLAPTETTRVEIAPGTPIPQTLYSVAGGVPRTEAFDRLIPASVHIRGIPAWDVNQDGAVDILDLVSIGRHFGESPPSDPRADVNGDGSVDVLDLVAVGRHFGERYRP